MSGERMVAHRDLLYSRLIEFQNDTDAERLRAVARWLELHPRARLVGIAVSTDYDGNGIDSMFYVTVEEPPPSPSAATTPAPTTEGDGRG